MSELSRFYGIVIAIFSEIGAQHNKAHIHARYAEFKASYDLDGVLIAGQMPPTANKLIKEWISRHSDELQDAWDKSLSGEYPGKIEPLK